MGLSDVAFDAASGGKRPADRWTERRLRGQPQRERRNEAEA